MKEIMYGDETVKVLEASGYNDGYYWDMNAKIEFKGETYSNKTLPAYPSGDGF